jgi:hypothetical protein
MFSPAVLSLLRSSEGAHPPLRVSAIVLLSRFAPTERDIVGVPCSYKHLAPLERKPIPLLRLQVEPHQSQLIDS